ncbi:hypothetical protein V7068_21250 [Bacillus sp. JJ634]
MPAIKKPDYRKNNCRFSKLEDVLLDIIDKIDHTPSKKVVEDIHKRLVKEEKAKVKEKQKRGK